MHKLSAWTYKAPTNVDVYSDIWGMVVPHVAVILKLILPKSITLLYSTAVVTDKKQWAEKAFHPSFNDNF